MTTLAKCILVAGLSLVLCRFVYSLDMFSVWINSASGVRALTPLRRAFMSIGPEDDENIILAVVLLLSLLASTLALLGTRAILSTGGRS
jgi:hypothetical protein